MVLPAFKEASNVIPLLPAPDPNDSDDVIVALQTARALQKKGDLRESLRWLRRAADAAGQEGNDRRAMVLARAAADLTSLVGASEKAPAPSSLPPPLPQAPKPASSLPPPPPSMAQRAARTQAVPSPSSLPPPLHKTPPPPPPPRSGPPPLPQPRVDVPAKQPEPATKPPIDVAGLAAGGSVVRVSIKRSVRDPNLLIVRKLDAGKALPQGRTEAYLVFADPKTDPFGGRAPKGKS
jgi:hypothetical protein